MMFLKFLRAVSFIAGGIMLGFMLASGDLECHFDPDAFRHLKDAVTTPGYAVGESVQRQDFRF